VISLSLPSAHGVLIGREDLPVPEWLFAWGASAVLIVSFVVLSTAWRSQRFDRDNWRPFAPALSRLVTSRITEVLAGAIGVFLLGVVVWSGLEGTEAANLNFAATFVFITFWLGTVALSVVFGDVFRAFNPWRAIAKAWVWAAALAGRRPRAPLEYPERLGRWPAVAGIVAFVWFELVYGAGAIQTTGITPHSIAIASIVYTGYALGGMALFGIDRWLARGEAFSVYFEMFSRLSVFEVRERRLGIRRILSATTTWAVVPGSLALVLATIGNTTFDGAQEGFLGGAIDRFANGLENIGLDALWSIRVSETLFFAVTLAAIALLYWIGVRGMRTVRGSPALRDLATAFAHTLIPIGLAYLVAHYFSLVFFGEQAQVTYLLSDPLGDGSDLFGTASTGIDYTLLSATAIWYIQVGALIVGHVTGLILAHDRAIGVYGEPRAASISQRWMLLVMVAFTCLGLFLLSQSNA
jgi:hypothetical protein